MFNYYTKQPLDAFGRNKIDELHQKFIRSGFNIEKLLVEISLVAVNYQQDANNK